MPTEGLISGFALRDHWRKRHGTHLYWGSSDGVAFCSFCYPRPIPPNAGNDDTHARPLDPFSEGRVTIACARWSDRPKQLRRMLMTPHPSIRLLPSARERGLVRYGGDPGLDCRRSRLQPSAARGRPQPSEIGTMAVPPTRPGMAGRRGRSIQRGSDHPRRGLRTAPRTASLRSMAMLSGRRPR
jgi:hypothetical protein